MHLATRCDTKKSPRILVPEITVWAMWKKLILAGGKIICHFLTMCNHNEQELLFFHAHYLSLHRVSTMSAAIGNSAFASGYQLLATVTVAEIMSYLLC